MKTRDCSHFRETLLRVQDDPQTAIPDELALHLDDCSTCRKLFDATKIDLDSDAFEVIPAAARKQIVDRLAAARRPRARWWVAAGVAAALVLVVAGSWLVVDHEPSRSHTALVAALVDDHIRYLDHHGQPHRRLRPGPDGRSRASVLSHGHQPGASFFMAKTASRTNRDRLSTGASISIGSPPSLDQTK